MNNYFAHPVAPCPVSSTALRANAATQRSLAVMRSLVEGRVGNNPQQRNHAQQALNHLFTYATEPDFNIVWDQLFLATCKLPREMPHMPAINNFLDAGVGRRLACLQQAVYRDLPAVARSHDLEVARKLAEVSPNPTVRFQANLVAASLRQLLMPDTVCVTKGDLTVPLPHPGFAPAFKTTYVAPTYNGRGVKVLREICTFDEKYLLECTTAAGTFGKIRLATTLDGRELVAKVMHMKENVKGKAYIAPESIKASNDLLVRCGSNLAAKLYLVEGRAYAFQVRYSGDMIDVTSAIPYSHPLRPAIMAKAFRDVAEDLERIHNAAMVHRDIKPENILYHPGTKMAVCDYDMANDGLTCKMQPVNPGTPIYMAPETMIYFGQTEYTEKSDQWSVGIAFFYMNAFDWRNVPFQRVNNEATMNEAFNETYDWRISRSPTGSPFGPLDWNLIKASQQPLDLAAKAFHAIDAPMAEYVVEQLLGLAADVRPDASSMAAKAREIYAPYAHLEAQIDETLQEVADQQAKPKAAAFALAGHVQTQQTLTSLFSAESVLSGP